MVSIEHQGEADAQLGLLGTGERVVHGAVEGPLVHSHSVGRGIIEREEEDVSNEVLEVGVPPEIQPLPGQATPCFVALPDVEGAMRFGVDPTVALEPAEGAVAEGGRLRRRGGAGAVEAAVEPARMQVCHAAPVVLGPRPAPTHRRTPCLHIFLPAQPPPHLYRLLLLLLLLLLFLFLFLFSLFLLQALFCKLQKMFFYYYSFFFVLFLFKYVYVSP